MQKQDIIIFDKVQQLPIFPPILNIIIKLTSYFNETVNRKRVSQQFCLHSFFIRKYTVASILKY